MILFLTFTVQREDYELNDRVLKLDSCETRKCVQVDIVNDEFVEDTETFTVFLGQSNFGFSNIIIEQNSASVFIEDDDGMFMSLKDGVIDIIHFYFQLLKSLLKVKFMMFRRQTILL